MITHYDAKLLSYITEWAKEKIQTEISHQPSVGLQKYNRIKKQKQKN